MTIKNEKTKEAETPDPSKGAEQGCKVDWSWLEGRTIASVTSDLQNLNLTFIDGLSFKVQALNYKGQPFLGFNPYQNPGPGKKAN